MLHTQVCSMAVTVLGLADLGCVQASVAPAGKPDLGLQAVSHSGTQSEAAVAS